MKSNYAKVFSFVLIFLGLFVCGVGIVSADFNPLDINNNGIVDSNESNVVLDTSVTLSAGEYVFNNLTITNGAVVTLLGDPNSASLFKGVKITANNLTVSSTATIVSDSQGYNSISGPGSSGADLYYAGGSYGGLGGNNVSTSIYGSETEPIDLGSGGGPCCAKGGGAIWLHVLGTLSNDGLISANGGVPSSGGSIYVTTDVLNGAGTFQANGGGLYYTGFFAGPGGGGRVAIYYNESTFIGIAEAKRGCGSIDGFSAFCAGDGTVVVKSLIPVCEQDCNSNVLFLPGIESSRLYKTAVVRCFDCEDRLWEPNINSDVEALYLDENGKSIDKDIYTRDVIDEAYGFVNIYKSFLSKLSELKNEEQINDYSAVPYDWRLSLDDILSSGKKDGDNIYYSKATSTPYILQELQRLVSSSKTGKVTIVAHSHGGLLAKALLQKLADEHNPLLNKIDQLILVAVPQLGTPTTIVANLHGYDQGIPTSYAPFAMNDKTAREFAQNSPMAYNLLPSEKYFSSVFTPVVTFDESLQDWISKYTDYIHSKVSLDNFLLDTFGRVSVQSSDTKTPVSLQNSFLTNAKNVHNILDNWTPPSTLQVIEIAGWGVPTVSGVNYKTVHGKITPEYNFTIDGDGTVVGPSALWTNGDRNIKKYWVNEGKYNNSHLDRKHKDILEVSDLLNLLKNNIQNEIINSSIYISTSTPESSDERRLVYALHSPLTLDIYDDLGNHTGFSTSTNRIEEQIPGTYFLQFGDVKYIFTNTHTPTHLSMSGYDTGTFTFTVSEVLGDETLSTLTFKDIPTTQNTKVRMDIPDDISSASALSVDEDGNGDSEIILTPVLNDTVTYVEPITVIPISLTISSSNGPITQNITSSISTSTIIVSTSTPEITKTSIIRILTALKPQEVKVEIKPEKKVVKNIRIASTTKQNNSQTAQVINTISSSKSAFRGIISNIYRNVMNWTVALFIRK